MCVCVFRQVIGCLVCCLGLKESQIPKFLAENKTPFVNGSIGAHGTRVKKYQGVSLENGVDFGLLCGKHAQFV